MDIGLLNTLNLRYNLVRPHICKPSSCQTNIFSRVFLQRILNKIPAHLFKSLLQPGSNIFSFHMLGEEMNSCSSSPPPSFHKRSPSILHPLCLHHLLEQRIPLLCISIRSQSCNLSFMPPVNKSHIKSDIAVDRRRRMVKRSPSKPLQSIMLIYNIYSRAQPITA